MKYADVIRLFRWRPSGARAFVYAGGVASDWRDEYRVFRVLLGFMGLALLLGLLRTKLDFRGKLGVLLLLG